MTTICPFQIKKKDKTLKRKKRKEKKKHERFERRVQRLQKKRNAEGERALSGAVLQWPPRHVVAVGHYLWPRGVSACCYCGESMV
jgi:hypothetical protein